MEEKCRQVGPQEINMQEEFKIFHYLDGSDYNSPMHHHSFYELYFLLSENLTYQIGNTIFAIKRGDILLFDIGQKHGPLFSGQEESYERIVLKVPKGTLERLSSGESDLAWCFRQSYPLLRLSPEMQNSVRLLLSKLLAAQTQEGFGSELIYKAYLTEIFVLLNRYYYGHTLALNNLAKKSLLVETINHYIDENINNPITVGDLAAHVYLSKYYFMRFFKTMTGTTVHRYLQQKRIIKACALMSEGETAASAAELSGFGDYSCFFRVFKNHFGYSPVNYVERQGLQSEVEVPF